MNLNLTYAKKIARVTYINNVVCFKSKPERTCHNSVEPHHRWYHDQATQEGLSPQAVGLRSHHSGRYKISLLDVGLPYHSKWSYSKL